MFQSIINKIELLKDKYNIQIFQQNEHQSIVFLKCKDKNDDYSIEISLDDSCAYVLKKHTIEKYNNLYVICWNEDVIYKLLL